MRNFNVRAFVPALVLLLAIATAVRANCAKELALGGTDGTAILIGTEERRQETYFPIVAPPLVTMGFIKIVHTTEVGTYLMPDGSRIRITCQEQFSRG